MFERKMTDSEIEAFRREAAARFHRHHDAGLAAELMACIEKVVARGEWKTIRQIQQEWRDLDHATTEQRVARHQSAEALRRLGGGDTR